MKSINGNDFGYDISQCIYKSDNNLPDLINGYNSKIQGIIDSHAPETTKEVIIRPNTQLYNSNLRQA